MSDTLVRGMPAGAVDLGGSNKAALAGHPVGAIHFGPACSTLWEEQPSLRELYDQACAGLVRAECEAEELRAEVAMLREERNILARAKAAVTEGAEPSCNDSAQAFRERPEPSPHFNAALWKAREALREIQAAVWKTSGELRGMARKALEAAK